MELVPFLSSRPCFAFTGNFGVLILHTMLPCIQTGSYPAGQADAGCARAAKPPIATTAAISFDFMGALRKFETLQRLQLLVAPYASKVQRDLGPNARFAVRQ